MLKKVRKTISKSTHASVKREMTKPRMAKSARIAERNLDSTRISEQPSVTMPGTVDKIIQSPRPSQPEKAHIAVDGADRRYRNLRIENNLIDENGDDRKLEKGARVEVTVTADPDTSAAAINKARQPARRGSAGLDLGRPRP
ncbi:MAG: hypothetical protein ABSA96_18205 [Candidatus Acidiferrales bacterium]|jgi:hypothetical protein